jgi:hypothetical protein
MVDVSGCIRVDPSNLVKKVGPTLRGVRMERGAVADTKTTNASFGLETGKLVFLTNTCGRITNHLSLCTVKAERSLGQSSRIERKPSRKKIIPFQRHQPKTPEQTKKKMKSCMSIPFTVVQVIADCVNESRRDPQLAHTGNVMVMSVRTLMIVRKAGHRRKSVNLFHM